MTDREQQPKSCKIERIASVAGLTDDLVRLEVEGKFVNVPRSKTSENLVLGDRVSWSGTVWVKIREEEVKNR
ncbi:MULTISPECIES: DUF3006 domain-containing protein [unclassified Paenibacillus]|uniref:DUF3006 domain-containing protein n=1 Tax=unclassified Paenibacillus TaxID=185978 RepID=UPI00104625F4|nr:MULTISPECIES: DUF3006 domain-containing protein [unclassified Paenibacillus]NIK68975.1 hypothetical protein [Paenibacillus sp. BK720]TCM98752.1 hypothetical protein EV294_10236 [Paenibacillus sp. BK033]